MHQEGADTNLAVLFQVKQIIIKPAVASPYFNCSQFHRVGIIIIIFGDLYQVNVFASAQLIRNVRDKYKRGCTILYTSH